MYTLSSIVHGIYWTCADMRTAFESAVNVSQALGAVIVVNEATRRSCVVSEGTVNVYQKDGREDYTKWK